MSEEKFRVDITLETDGESVDNVERWLNGRLYDVGDVKDVQFIEAPGTGPDGEYDPWLDDVLQFARLIVAMKTEVLGELSDGTAGDLAVEMKIEEVSDVKDLFRRAEIIWDEAKKKLLGLAEMSGNLGPTIAKVHEEELGRLGPTLAEVHEEEREEEDRRRSGAAEEWRRSGSSPDEPDDTRYPPDDPADFHGVP